MYVDFCKFERIFVKLKCENWRNVTFGASKLWFDSRHGVVWLCAYCG